MGWKSPSNTSLCPICSRSAYSAESFIAADRTPYHKVCLKCCQCSKRLSPATINEHDQKLYCQQCYQHLFIAQGDNGTGDKRKMQVLPHGGQFDKDPLNFGPDQEYLRREAAVQATLRTMKELAKTANISQQTQACIKIEETVSICL